MGEGSRSARKDLMVLTLQVAVPLWVDKLVTKEWSYVEQRAKARGQHLAEHGDILQFKSKTQGETSRAFNHLAEGIAALSFSPGGVEFQGVRWENHHPDNATGTNHGAV